MTRIFRLPTQIPFLSQILCPDPAGQDGSNNPNARRKRANGIFPPGSTLRYVAFFDTQPMEIADLLFS